MRSYSLYALLCTIGTAIILSSFGPACSAQSSKTIFLYAGKHHKTFLGCLNCSETSEQSICNEDGRYGWDLQPQSIWNNSGEFGSDLSPSSPWNDLGQHPPVILDTNGNSYGYFTTNSLYPDRTQIPWVLSALNSYAKTNDRARAHKLLCDVHNSNTKASTPAADLAGMHEQHPAHDCTLLFFLHRPCHAASRKASGSYPGNSR